MSAGDLGGLGLHVLAPVAVGGGDGPAEVGEGREPAAGRLGEVGAGVEGAAVGGEEHGHRPAARPRQRQGRLHVEGVDVRALLAVDLHVDEELVHHARPCRRPRTTRAPSRGTSGTTSSRSTAAPAGPRRGPARGPPRPRGTSRPGSRRAGGGRGWTRRRVGSRSEHSPGPPMAVRYRCSHDRPVHRGRRARPGTWHREPLAPGGAARRLGRAGRRAPGRPPGWRPPCSRSITRPPPRRPS